MTAHHVYRRSSLLVLLILLSLSSCRNTSPVISNIYPKAGEMGEVISISGSGFGKLREMSAVSIAGIEPTASAYREWTDTLIKVQVPLFGDSGLVYVRVGKKRSNPALFTNIAAIPIPVERSMGDDLPSITSISPQKASPGSLVILNGKNFGDARGQGAVLFSWASEDTPRGAAGQTQRNTVEASQSEYAYELWSDREIRVRVPEGAKTGPVSLRTRNGTESSSAWFEADTRAGIRSYRDRRTYAISYSVNYQVQKASRPNKLYMWIPSPVLSSSQSSSQLLSRTAEPFIETANGYSLYQFKDLVNGSRETLTTQRTIDVWAVETKIAQQALRKTGASPIRSSWTLPAELIPSDDESIVSLAKEISARGPNDWERARSIYEWMLSNVFIADIRSKTSVIEDLESLESDPCNAALLFCALARAIDIPAIPVAGFLVARNRSSRPHWWAEFWLDDFGWVPVDPTMGAGTISPIFVFKDNPREYYFGNIDSQRIAFSRGFVMLSQMDPRGRTSSRPKSYSLQNIWEEAVGDLESYSTLWSDLSVTGIY